MIQRDHPSCRLLADYLGISTGQDTTTQVPKLMSFASFQGSKVALDRNFKAVRI